MLPEKLKIAAFIDFDNIQIGVRSTLQREFDVALVLDALKERGELITKIAYANWGRMENSTRQLSEHAVQMVQRDPSPRGDKNGADINLALDALELAFTHHHINAFAIVSGDSDFIALVNKLKQYNKLIFVVGGKAFTSTILQKNCHEFVSYESLLDDRPAPASQSQSPSQGQPHGQRPDKGGFHKPEKRRPAPLELAQSMPLVERALQVLERREVRPQLGLLKSTMLQLDSSFSEKAYGSSSFTDFIEKLHKTGLVTVSGSEGKYMITRKGEPAKAGKQPEEALPMLRDLLETHRLDVDEGAAAEDLATWTAQEYPQFDCKTFGFQQFSELLNYAQDKGVVRVEPSEEGGGGLTVYLGAEFHPPAVADAPPPTLSDEQPKEEPQPMVMGQPVSALAKAKRPRKKPSGDGPKRSRRKPPGVMQ
ncbi:MAG: NYN domain-containing protein [Bryobacteraceae bacterium]